MTATLDSDLRVSDIHEVFEVSIVAISYWDFLHMIYYIHSGSFTINKDVRYNHDCFFVLWRIPEDSLEYVSKNLEVLGDILLSILHTIDYWDIR